LRAQQTAVALHARLTALVARAAALSPARAAGLRADEDALRVELERARGEVDRVRAKAGELWAGVGAVKKRKEEGDGVEWAVSDEEGLRRVLEVRPRVSLPLAARATRPRPLRFPPLVAQILSSQQAGLDHVSRTVRGMAGDVDVMNQAFGLPATRVVAGTTAREGQ